MHGIRGGRGSGGKERILWHPYGRIGYEPGRGGLAAVRLPHQRPGNLLQRSQLDPRRRDLCPRGRRALCNAPARGKRSEFQHAARMGRRAIQPGNFLSPVRRTGHFALARFYVRLRLLSRSSGSLPPGMRKGNGISNSAATQPSLHGAILRQQRKPPDFRLASQPGLGHPSRAGQAIWLAAGQSLRARSRVAQLPGNSLLEQLALWWRAPGRRG